MLKVRKDQPNVRAPNCLHPTIASAIGYGGSAWFGHFLSSGEALTRFAF